MKTVFLTFLLLQSCGIAQMVQEEKELHHQLNDFIIENKTDEFNGTSAVVAKNIDLQPIRKYHERDKVRLSVWKLVSKNGDISYAIDVWFVAKDWLFIEAGNSLQFLLDGQLMEINAKDESYRKAGSGYIFESSRHDVTSEQIRQIVNAAEVKVRIIGEYPFDCLMSQQSKNYIGQFYSQYVK